MDINKMSQWIERYEAARFKMNNSLNTMIKQQIDPHLTLEQYTLLASINQSGKCTPTELSDLFCVNKSAITAMITRLEGKGLIERVRDVKDRRVVYLSLTEEGRTMCELGNRNIARQLGRNLQKCTEAEIETFITSFEKLAELMQQEDGEE